jgi:hypothetical protein
MRGIDRPDIEVASPRFGGGRMFLTCFRPEDDDESFTLPVDTSEAILAVVTGADDAPAQ